MTPITERLAEALRKCEAAFSDIFAQCASKGLGHIAGCPLAAALAELAPPVKPAPAQSEPC